MLLAGTPLMLTFLEARGSLSGGLSTEPSTDPVAEGPGEQGGEEHHRPTEFPDADRRTSVPSGLGFCFLCFCFLLRGNSTANFIFSSLKHAATNRGRLWHWTYPRLGPG